MAPCPPTAWPAPGWPRNPATGAGFLFLVFGYLAKTTGLFSGKMFLTDRRLGFCLTLLWKINFAFKFINIAERLIWLDVIAVTGMPSAEVPVLDRPLFAGAHSPRLRKTPLEALVSIRQFDESVLRAFWLDIRSLSGFLFLESLMAAVQDSAIYVSKALKSVVRAYGAADEERELGGPSLGAWYERAKALPGPAGGGRPEDFKGLQAIARALLEGEDNNAEESENLKNHLEEKEIRVAALGYRPWEEAFFINKALGLTDRRIIKAADKNFAEIVSSFPYGEVEIKRVGQRILIRAGPTRPTIAAIPFSPGNFPLFPVADTLIMLGCGESPVRPEDLNIGRASLPRPKRPRVPPNGA